MENINWVRVNRGGLHALLHNPDTNTLALHWDNGSFERWGNVAPVEAANMAAAPAPEKYFRLNIKPTAVSLPLNEEEEAPRSPDA
jgi:hypothetical protein